MRCAMPSSRFLTLAVVLGEQLLALDINPLVVHAKGHGVVAVDALVQIG